MYKKINKEMPEWQLFKDIYSYTERFGVPENSDEFWQNMHDQGKELCEKYREQGIYDFAKKMVYAVMDEIARRSNGNSTETEDIKD